MVRRGRGTLPLEMREDMTRAIAASIAGPEAQLAQGLVPAVVWHTNIRYSSALSVPDMSASRFCASPLKFLHRMSTNTRGLSPAATAASRSPAW